MTSPAHSFATLLIGDVVRSDVAAAQVFADLGIGPRYLFWTLEAAAKAQGISIDTLMNALRDILSRNVR